MYQLHSFSPPFPLEGEGGGQLLVLILSVWADFKSSTMDICLYLLICFLSEKDIESSISNVDLSLV